MLSTCKYCLSQFELTKQEEKAWLNREIDKPCICDECKGLRELGDEDNT